MLSAAVTPVPYQHEGEYIYIYYVNGDIGGDMGDYSDGVEPDMHNYVYVLCRWRYWGDI